MIGGLLQNESKANVEQLPWLGSLPVLGQLFSSRSYLKRETDLAIIVTPRLVRPARPGSVMASPLDSTLPANDPDFFTTGNAELSRTDQRGLLGGGGLLGNLLRPARIHRAERGRCGHVQQGHADR